MDEGILDMRIIKKYLNRIFVDSLSGMALGLFCTLIMGTILQQIGSLIEGNLGNIIIVIGKIAAASTCAGIGMGVAFKLKEDSLVAISAAVCGMVGGFATPILSNEIFSHTGTITLSGPGEPLGAFIAALIGIEIGHIFSRRTKIDIILTPFITIIIGSFVGLSISPKISSFMTWLGSIIMSLKVIILFSILQLAPLVGLAAKDLNDTAVTTSTDDNCKIIPE